MQRFGNERSTGLSHGAEKAGKIQRSERTSEQQQARFGWVCKLICQSISGYPGSRRSNSGLSSRAGSGFSPVPEHISTQSPPPLSASNSRSLRSVREIRKQNSASSSDSGIGQHNIGATSDFLSHWKRFLAICSRCQLCWSSRAFTNTSQNRSWKTLGLWRFWKWGVGRRLVARIELKVLDFCVFQVQ